MTTQAPGVSNEAVVKHLSSSQKTLPVTGWYKDGERRKTDLKNVSEKTFHIPKTNCLTGACLKNVTEKQKAARNKLS